MNRQCGACLPPCSQFHLLAPSDCHTSSAVPAACRQAYRRDIVAVANPETLEVAVRDCVEEGANKVGSLGQTPA